MPRKVFAYAAISALLVRFGAWPASAQKAAHVTGVTAQAEPAQYDGPCPKMFRFTGVITVDRPGRLKYQWLHSDGKHRPPGTTFFASPSAHTVRDTWTLGSSSAPSHYTGYARLRILWPSTGLSDKATFTLNCVPRGPQKRTQ
jgi:uncharacterized protein YndB with AHSA1/START domain